MKNNYKRWLRLVRALTLGTSVVAVATPSIAATDVVPIWSIQITAPKTRCASIAQFSWGDLAAFNRRGARPSLQKCNVIPFNTVAGLDFYIPKHPLRIAWLGERGEHRTTDLALREILQNYDVYGGRIDLRLTETGVEVWLEEPDKSAAPEANFWAKKPAKMVRSVPAHTR